MNHEIINYDNKKFDFQFLIKELFQCFDLYDLHKSTTEQYTELFKVGDDSKTIWHKKFYDKYRDAWREFDDLYEQLIKEIIAPTYDEDFLYQRKITLRIHLPNNLAVGDFHTDKEFHHPSGEMNYILPLTFAYGTASVWVESKKGEKDYNPFKMRPDEIIKFDGNQLSHGNKINKSCLTRVSFDFRVLPLSLHKEHESKESITTKTKFKIGEYYKLFVK